MLRLKGGIVVSNPIPLEHSIDNTTIEKAIKSALSSMQDHGISGKEVTPYLLSKIKEVTYGKSLAANVALIENNARLGAEIAKCNLRDK
jgi:pseudouridine-5'-phosphate glycosidase